MPARIVASPRTSPKRRPSFSRKGVNVNRSFVWGVVVGLGGLYAYHKFVKPVPGKGQ